jgi:NADH-quinone oxidoreductase subunit G
VIELCPVGALLSTQYRFEGRPWEVQNVPTVCGMCPVGCNIDVTTREGKVKRILSRNHPEVDGGWLCDKGRFAFTHLYAKDRIRDPLRRVRRRGFEELSWDDAIDEAERMLRSAAARVVTALSGSETVEQAYALAKLLRQGLGAHSALLPEATSDALEAFRLPLSAIADAEVVVVLGDVPVDEAAPIVGLWLRAARRNGAEIAYELDEERVRGSDRAILIWSGAGAGGAHAAALAHKLGFAGKDDCGAFYLPATPNGRGIAEAWAAAADVEEKNPEPIGLLIVSGDEAAANPSVRAMAEEAESVLVTCMFEGLTVGWADLVLPGTSYLERDGTYVNLEGRLQRLRRTAIPPAPDELAWISKLAERFHVELPPYPAAVFKELSDKIYGGLPFGEVGEHAALRARTEPEETAPAEPLAGKPRGLRLVRYKALFSGPAVERVPELQFQRPPAEVELSPDDARKRKISSGDEVTVSHDGTSVTLRARVNKSLRRGLVRIADEHAGELAMSVEVTK